MKRALLLLPLLLLGCAKEDRTGLERRPLAAPAQSGWARVRLDGRAQLGADSLWISDANGQSVPFLRERDDLWAPAPLETSKLIVGRDEAGHPSADFELKLPEGWQLREREQLRLDLELSGEGPWVCRVDLARKLEGGAFVLLDTGSPLFAYDLGSGRRSAELTVPWDALRYRISLIPTQGAAPKLTGLRVTACTRPGAMKEDALVPLQLVQDHGLRLKLPAAERVVGLDVVLQAPVAPVYATVSLPPKGEETVGLGSGLLWNLPALQSRSTRIALEPTVAEELRLELPAGVTALSAQALVRREVLLFPAEAGQAYSLHEGGLVKAAPGSLEALPTSRAAYGREPLALGAAEPDPQGQPHVVSGGERTRPWLPWAVGAAVALLALAALKLLKGGD